MSVAVAAAGIDTWSPCWWLDPTSAAARHLAALCTGRAGGGGLYPDAIAGHRVGYYGTGLVWAEGHPVDGRLACADELAPALDVLEVALLEAGVPLPMGRAGGDLYGDRHEGRAGIRRLDSTVDLSVSSSAEGVAILAGVAAIARDAPRCKGQVVFSVDGRAVETVYMRGHGGRSVLGRFYDKGAESGQAARGRLLRPEDQRRWAKGSRRAVEELSGVYVRDKFTARFAPMWRASKGVMVAGVAVLTERLGELLDEGVITPTQAETLAGHLILSQRAGGRLSARTRRRRRAQLRDHGLVLADGVLQEVEVDVSAVLEAAMESDAWAARG